jgi:hypothetical protein
MGTDPTGALPKRPAFVPPRGVLAEETGLTVGLAETSVGDEENDPNTICALFVKGPPLSAALDELAETPTVIGMLIVSKKSAVKLHLLHRASQPIPVAGNR